MKTLSTLLLGLALIAAPGCSRDDDTRTAPRASRSSGSGDDGARATAARDDDDDVDAEADEYADDSATASASGGTASATPQSADDPPSAQDQPMANTDEDITRQIRQALVGDGSLSIMARNATIVTRSGVVTLRGTVSEADERSAIERHARAVGGVSRVDNRIAVRD